MRHRIVFLIETRPVDILVDHEGRLTDVDFCAAINCAGNFYVGPLFDLRIFFSQRFYVCLDLIVTSLASYSLAITSAI